MENVGNLCNALAHKWTNWESIFVCKTVRCGIASNVRTKMRSAVSIPYSAFANQKSRFGLCIIIKGIFVRMDRR